MKKLIQSLTKKSRDLSMNQKEQKKKLKLSPGDQHFANILEKSIAQRQNQNVLESEPNNLIGDTCSYYSDYSGNGSDITYCPDHDEESKNSSQDSNTSSPGLLLDEPSTSSGIYHGNLNEGRKRQANADPDS
ncbi:hypothetical protein EVAR_12749_1 [Eumeta japonica]|uniref:Uncharacterized protein n=1 Tax=Eumeta variegata TaxID=151549 RepID=A0A4C1SKV6_EUMVA|nr:hypothetical protein EVAR_12749_1 [Eumeta japonica]